jgi:hypothetical protein
MGVESGIDLALLNKASMKKLLVADMVGSTLDSIHII